MSSDTESADGRICRIKSPIPGFDAEVNIAGGYGVNPALFARPRKKGLIDYFYFGGFVFDKLEGERSVGAYIRSRIKRRNPPRSRTRRRATNETTIDGEAES